MDRKIYLFLVLVFTFLVLMGEAVAQQKFNFTVVKAGSGTGTVTSSPSGIKCGSDCTEAYTQGKTVSLNAKADPGSYFVGWSDACSGTKTCKVTMNADTAVTATFEQKIPDISVSPDSIDFGSVEVGKTVTYILQIANSGTGDLQITISGLEGTIFSIRGKSDITIKPQKTYSLKVICKPTTGSADLSGQTVTFEAADELEEPDANESEDLNRALDAIVLKRHNAKMNFKTNVPAKPSIDLPIAVLVLPPIKQGPSYVKIDANWTLNGPGTDFEADFTAIESGTVAIKLVNNIIDCGEGVCKGTTKFSLTGHYLYKEAACDQGEWSVNNLYTLVGNFDGKNLNITILEAYQVPYTWAFSCPGYPFIIDNLPPPSFDFNLLTSEMNPFGFVYAEGTQIIVPPPKPYKGQVTLGLHIGKK